MLGFGIVDFIVGKQNIINFINGLVNFKFFCLFILIYVYVLVVKGQLCNFDIDQNLIIYICNMYYLIMINLKQEFNWLFLFM